MIIYILHFAYTSSKEADTYMKNPYSGWYKYKLWYVFQKKVTYEYPTLCMCVYRGLRYWQNTDWFWLFFICFGGNKPRTTKKLISISLRQSQGK